jgi:hypothetical protein
MNDPQEPVQEPTQEQRQKPEPDMKIKPNKLDKMLEHLEQSEMLTKLIGKIGRVLGRAFFGEAPTPEIRTVEKIVEKPVFKDRIVEKPVIQEKIVDRIVEKEKRVTVTPEWAAGLEQYQRLLTAVSGHAELRPVLLAGGGDTLLALLANASQWDNLLRVWDVLASRCKKGETLTPDEHAAMHACMQLYNLTLLDRQAQWQDAEAGGDYDYQQHQRVGNKGERIKAQVLPGVINAGGIVVRKVLVSTE